MRLTPIIAGAAALALTASPALAWTNQDHEIFDIVSALESAEGKGTTFYSFLNVTKGATPQEINRAYRKRSLELHPDKNPDNKKIADRFARLGVIGNILRDDERRKHYDFFHDNGVPKWRGTGYYYSRYRPGLGLVLTGLTLFSCFIHYVFLYLTYRVNKMRINAFREQAFEAAWGPSKKPLAGKRKMKTKTSEQGSAMGMPGINGGRPIGAGSLLELAVEAPDKVYVIENRKENLITEDLAIKPLLRDTWLPRAILGRLGYEPSASAAADSPSSSRSAARKPSVKKTFRKPSPSQFEDSASGGGATSGEEATSGGEDSAAGSGAGSKGKGPGRGIEGMGKVGGRRRKTVPRPQASS
ncbi:DnaJ-domain-containing protein [Rhodotorula diobovata]|uniref:DnaJ-domain-containing protein n=1 Tax=Rhodotorula diobovata TaxID=5288 RepID=A0A5C5G4X7_9BASI|nr:DnaJ-domain-containing protein [Rhodotorula diobovata]